jgi:hypothetical protein
MIDRDFPKTLAEFNKRFATERECLNYIRKQRWGASDAKFR